MIDILNNHSNKKDKERKLKLLMDFSSDLEYEKSGFEFGEIKKSKLIVKTKSTGVKKHNKSSKNNLF